MTKLTVVEAKEEDVFKDIVRVNSRNRRDRSDAPIPSGAVCRVRVRDRSVLAIVRGLSQSEGSTIRIDEFNRKRLGVKGGEEVQVGIERAGFFYEFAWCWNATQPSYRLTARLALVSVVMGFIGLSLGVISIFLSAG